ncbi:uncharacterized protein LOC134264190 [Saccostrea cucullata]|uniref:uncharacterized protein LOC134264190 n=1 Tax=Saccostrea cuccullata TaxID=36930 RepID=UPI002ED21C20
MEGKRLLSTPLKTPRKIKLFRPSGTTPKKLKEVPHIEQKAKKNAAYAARCIENYKYQKAFSHLYRHYAGARRAILVLVKREIRKGIQMLLRDKENKVHNKCTYENLKDFKWPYFTEALEQFVPILSTAITAAITTKKNERSLAGSRGQSLIPAIGLVASILLHMRSPKMNLVQGLHGVELWRCGAQRKIFPHLNRMGFCVSYDTTLNILSKIRVNVDEKAWDMKKNIEEHMSLGFYEPLATETDSDSDSGDRTEEERSEDSEEIDQTISSSESESDSYLPMANIDGESASSERYIGKELQSKGYCLVWDNVGKMVRVSRQSSERQNKMLLWALSYCVENRIATCHMNDQIVTRAIDIPLEKFLPRQADFKEVRQRMTVIVARIIVQEIPFFKEHFMDCVPKHIRHKFWRESSKKSNVINLGVCQENPSTIEGTIRILEKLQEYVPTHGHRIFPLICYGDGLSCERHNDAHLARSNAGTPLAGLQGLQPVVQELHKRMLLTQDIMDIFFSGKSAADKGTLFYLKNVFGHRAVKKQVGDAFNHISTFLKFVTYGYTMLAAMEVLGMESLSDSPIDIGEIYDRQRYLTNVAEKVVELVWFEMDVTKILNAGGEVRDYNFCFCKEDLGDDAPMVECTGMHCPGKNWFHVDCITGGQGDVDIPDDFACSEECRRSYKFCCGVDLGRREPMIACDNPGCPVEWFHMKCIGLASAPSGEWYCSRCKDIAKTDEVVDKPDLHNMYVKALTYMGLMDLVRHDAVRENDGEAMMGHWRMDLVQFHNRHHPKYVVLAHRLLAGIEGWLPERLRMDSIWNRTVNLTAGPGRNMEADIVNEFLNKEFKDSLKDAGGNLTVETVARHSQMVGSFGKTLDKIFMEAADLNFRDFTKHESDKFSSDLPHFVKLLHKENFFKVVPDRSFHAFQNFSFDVNALFPERLQKKLVQRSKELDKIRRNTAKF